MRRLAAAGATLACYRISKDTKTSGAVKNELRFIHNLVDIHAIYNTVKELLCVGKHTELAFHMLKDTPTNGVRPVSRCIMHTENTRNQMELFMMGNHAAQLLARSYETETHDFLAVSAGYPVNAPNVVAPAAAAHVTIMEHFMTLQAQVSFLQATLRYASYLPSRVVQAVRFLLKELSRFTSDPTTPTIHPMPVVVCELCETAQCTENTVCESCRHTMVATEVISSPLNMCEGMSSSQLDTLSESRNPFAHIKLAMTVFQPSPPKNAVGTDPILREMVAVFRATCGQTDQDAPILTTIIINRLAEVKHEMSFQCRAQLCFRLELRVTDLLQSIISAAHRLSLDVGKLHPLYAVFCATDQLLIDMSPEDTLLVDHILSSEEIEAQDHLFHAIHADIHWPWCAWKHRSVAGSRIVPHKRTKGLCRPRESVGDTVFVPSITRRVSPLAYLGIT